MKDSDSLRLADYLSHILEAIRRIDVYTAEMSEVSFLENLLVQDAVIRNFEIIGEASRNIDRVYPAFREEHAEVPWIPAYEMRNALSHGYFKVDLGIVWQTIHNHLPGFADQVRLLAGSDEVRNAGA